MPLCGIISSECLGTLPGAWAKQCENVSEVNCCEGLWDTAWTSCPGAPRHIRSCPDFPAKENEMPPLVSCFMPLSLCAFCSVLLDAQYLRYAGGYSEGARLRFIYSNIVLTTDVCRFENNSNNSRWLGIIPFKQSSENIKLRKQCANVTRRLQVLSIYRLFLY